MNSIDSIVTKLMESRHLSEDYDPMFDEDLKKYRGKALKELLVGLSGKVRLDIRTNRPTHEGTNGFGGMCNQVPWYYADLIIKDIAAGDRKYVDVYIVI